MQKAMKITFVFQVQQAHPQAVPSVLQRQVRKKGGPFSEETVLEYPIVILTQAMSPITSYRGPEVNPVQVNLAATVHPSVLLGRKHRSHEPQSPNIPCTIRLTTQDQPTLKEMTFCRHLIRSEYQHRHKRSQ